MGIICIKIKFFNKFHVLCELRKVDEMFSFCTEIQLESSIYQEQILAFMEKKSMQII
jgi:hypothetical protein